MIKQIIISTAEDIDAPADQQGAGILDAYQAVLAASRTTAASRDRARHPGEHHPVQRGRPAGHPENLTETLTNDGAEPVTVGLSSRTLGAYTACRPSAVADRRRRLHARRSPSPCPPGQARLNASVVSQVGAGQPQPVSPQRDLAEYNLPQGVGNYGDAQVADPAPGTWTALISTTGTGPAVPAAVPRQHRRVAALRDAVRHSLTLAPGASSAVTLTVATPPHAG